MDQAGVVPCWRELCPAKMTTRNTESAQSLLDRKIDSCDLGLVERGGWKAIHCHLGVMDSKDVARRQATAVDRRKGGLGRRVFSRVLGKNGGVCHKQDYFRTTIGLVGNVTVNVTVFWFWSFDVAGGITLNGVTFLHSCLFTRSSMGVIYLRRMGRGLDVLSRGGTDGILALERRDIQVGWCLLQCVRDYAASDVQAKTTCSVYA